MMRSGRFILFRTTAIYWICFEIRRNIFCDLIFQGGYYMRFCPTEIKSLCACERVKIITLYIFNVKQRFASGSAHPYELNFANFAQRPVKLQLAASSIMRWRTRRKLGWRGGLRCALRTLREKSAMMHYRFQDYTGRPPWCEFIQDPRRTREWKRVRVRRTRRRRRRWMRILYPRVRNCDTLPSRRLQGFPFVRETSMRPIISVAKVHQLRKWSFRMPLRRPPLPLPPSTIDCHFFATPITRFKLSRILPAQRNVTNLKLFSVNFSIVRTWFILSSYFWINFFAKLKLPPNIRKY